MRQAVERRTLAQSNIASSESGYAPSTTIVRGQPDVTFVR